MLWSKGIRGFRESFDGSDESKNCEAPVTQGRSQNGNRGFTLGPDAAGGDPLLRGALSASQTWGASGRKFFSKELSFEPAASSPRVPRFSL